MYFKRQLNICLENLVACCSVHRFFNLSVQFTSVGLCVHHYNLEGQDQGRQANCCDNATKIHKNHDVAYLPNELDVSHITMTTLE